MTRPRPALLLASHLLPGLTAIGIWLAVLHEPSPAPRYPELDAADDLAVNSLLAGWPCAFERPAAPERFRSMLRSSPSLEILQAIRRRYAGRDHADCTKGRWPKDEEDAPAGVELAARREPGRNPLLLRMLSDRQLHPEARLRIVIALCWEGNAAAIGPLVDLALDPEEPAWLREDALYRLPRISRALPGRLKDLLYQPFKGLDQIAAATLARTGDPEAPSLVLDGLRRLDPEDANFGPHLAGAVSTLARGEPTLRKSAEAVDRVTREGLSWSVSYLGDPDEAERREAGRKARVEAERAARVPIDELVRLLDAHLAAHPELRETALERVRSGFDTHALREREIALDTFEDVLDAGEDLDLAAAALTLGVGRSDLRDRWLEALHRLSALLRRDTAGLADPEAALDALRRRLIPQRGSISGYTFEDGPPSFLSLMLREQCGNPLAQTLLLLAVGDRIGLPLFAKWSPDRGLRAATDPEGALTKRELLSRVPLMKAIALLRHDRHSAACESAERSIRLHEPNGAAHLVMATACFHLGFEYDPQVLEHLEIAAELLPPGEGWGPAVGILLALERYDRAIEAARAHDPADLDAAAAEAVCLLHLGHPRDALSRMLACVEQAPDRPDFALSLAQIRAVLHARGWRDALAAVDDPVLDPRVHLAIAAALVAEIPGHEPRPELALEVLEPVRPLTTRSFEEHAGPKLADRRDIEEWMERQGRSGLLRRDFFVDGRRRWHLLRSRALLLQGDREGAVEEFRAAEREGPATRAVHELRRRLGLD